MELEKFGLKKLWEKRWVRHTDYHAPPYLLLKPGNFQIACATLKN